MIEALLLALAISGGVIVVVDLFRKLHTFNFPPLTSHPRFRLVVGLCLCGFAFSLTGVVLAWRRPRMSFAGPEGRA